MLRGYKYVVAASFSDKRHSGAVVKARTNESEMQKGRAHCIRQELQKLLRKEQKTPKIALDQLIESLFIGVELL